MKITAYDVAAVLTALLLFPGVSQSQSLVENSQPAATHGEEAFGTGAGTEASNLAPMFEATSAAHQKSPPQGGSAPPAAAAARDYSIVTASVASSTDFQEAAGTSPSMRITDRVQKCGKIEAPPAALGTLSKYKQNDSSKSTIDEGAMASRDKVVRPIRNAIRSLTNLAYAPSDNAAVVTARAECVLENVDRWAKAGSLSEMKSVDAYLSRDRWVAEIALAVKVAQTRVELNPERKLLYSQWLGGLAKDTMQAYQFRLGPKSRTNNHRYWAGLSVAAIGHLVNDQEFKAWGKMSFEIGACQVDDFGLLPTELARGDRALDYHVYALRPLAAIKKLASESGDPFESKCLEGFFRLASLTRNALLDPTEFEKLAGLRQKRSSQENSYSAALKLEALPIYQ